MIEINLSTVKKPLDLSNVGGMDLSRVNVKLVLVAIMLAYVPDFFLVPSWEAAVAEEEEKVVALRAEQKKLDNEVDALSVFDKQIEALKRQEEKLREKLTVVQGILTKKQNPWGILVYVARNIPAEVWITQLTIQGGKLTLKGASQDYTPQGIFLENLKKSVFFDKNILYSKATATATPTAGPEDKDVKSLAPFEITATITRYE